MTALFSIFKLLLKIAAAPCFCVFKKNSTFLAQRAGTSSLPAMNDEFGREEIKHDRLSKKQNLKTLEILPQMQTQALWYDRQLQWTSLHKMLAVP